MPDDEAERMGVLVIRAWIAPGDRVLRARVTGRADILAREETSELVTGTEPAVRVVRSWLVAFESETLGRRSG